MRQALTALSLVLAASTVQADPADLADTRWELLEIRSMDDSTYVPDEPDLYTLAFDADGTVSIRSDCNRVSGTWSSEGPRLTFDGLAGTLALCPGDSLDDRYRSQFPWVRSYVMEGGHLFLATMADGAIIEFRPPEETTVTARVLGEEIRSQDPDEVQARVLTPLFQAYAAEHGIAATPEEVDTYLASMDRRLKAELGDDYESPDDLPPAEAAEMRRMRADMAEAMISRWKLNRALYEEFGGRVIFQQLGVEPLDAYRHYLEARQAAGDFEILDESMEASFWGYFTDDTRHSFLTPEQARNAFASPPWSDQ